MKQQEVQGMGIVRTISTRLSPVLVVGVFFGAACAPAAPPAPTSQPAKPAAPAATAAPAKAADPTAAKPAAAAPAAKPASPSAVAPPQDWQRQWDLALAGARQEGVVSVVHEVGQLYREWLAEFEREYPGIKVEPLSASGRDAVPRVLTERTAGQFLWDVNIGGNASGNTGFKPAGALAPMLPALLLPDVLDDSKWRGGFLDGFTDTEGKYMYGHRTELNTCCEVNRDVVPESELSRVEDIVDPKWKGKISWDDPRRAGSGVSVGAHFVMIAGEDWYRKLLAQQPTITTDKRQQVDWLVRGQYPISIATGDEATATYRAQGLMGHVKTLAPESQLGVRLAVSLGMGIFDRPPHPNAQKVFINWALSRQGQTMWMKYLTNQASRRADVESARAPKSGVTYPPSVNKEVNGRFEKLAGDLAKEAFP